MPVVALDTHAVVKELQAAGFTEAQAEAVTRAVRKGQDIDFSDLATKADLQGVKFDINALRKELKADNDGLRKDTTAQITGVKFDLLKWVIGAIGLQTLAILGALLGLARLIAR